MLTGRGSARQAPVHQVHMKTEHIVSNLLNLPFCLTLNMPSVYESIASPRGLQENLFQS